VKSLLTSLVITLLVITSLSAQDLEQGLVAYFPFIGDCTNQGDNEHISTNHGATLTADRFGRTDNAYYFDGINDYISVSSSVASTPPYTICAWAKAASNSGVAHRYILANGGERNEYHGFSLSQDPETDEWTLYGRINGRGGYAAGSSISSEWVFLCASWDGTDDANSIKLYVNGQLADEQTPSNISCGGSTLNLKIGNTAINANHYFQGSIDDIRIYDRILSLSEIGLLYHEGENEEGFCDEFNGSSIDNSFWTVSTGSWSQDDGRLTGTWPVSDADNNNGIILIENSYQPAGDYEFEVDFIAGSSGAIYRPRIALHNSYKKNIFIQVLGEHDRLSVQVFDGNYKEGLFLEENPSYLNNTPGAINTLKRSCSPKT
jgi:hypothetical protein